MCCCSFSSFVRSARICASDACIAGSATASASANGMCRWSATRRASSASSARHATLGSGSGLYCATRWAYARTNRGHATPHRPCLSRKAMTTMMVVWREARPLGFETTLQTDAAASASRGRHQVRGRQALRRRRVVAWQRRRALASMRSCRR